MTILVTGSAGFFGSILVQRLLDAGHTCIGIDLEADDKTHANYTAVQGDIRDLDTLHKLFSQHQFDAVMHCAAILAHVAKDKQFLWESNVDGTRNIRDMAVQYRVPKIIFTSSNCLWGEDLGHPIHEDDQPNPIEVYGRSKWEGEKVLQAAPADLHTIIIRCPTIMDSGRLGLLSILFEFIDEDRKVWVINGGHNEYQFIYAQDLATACIQALDYHQSALWHIGADDVSSFKEMYDYVIREGNSKARVAAIPGWLALPGMRLAYRLGVSPLGPYQYKMIAENFRFDTSKIKAELGWQPTVGNKDMLLKAYQYYHEHRKDLKTDGVSAHKQPAKMGIIRLVKWLS